MARSHTPSFPWSPKSGSMERTPATNYYREVFLQGSKRQRNARGALWSRRKKDPACVLMRRSCNQDCDGGIDAVKK